ncbi:MAG: Gfo/Idh/MocA family oxidoreductase, partial [Nanoarchaeota archaeon]
MCTKIDDPANLDEIIDVVRNKGKLVAIGDLLVPYPFSKLVRKEIDILVSRSHGPGRFDKEYEEKGKIYPLEHVRWTSDRNINEILHLLKEKKLSVRELISAEFDMTQAEKAYSLLMKRPDTIGVVLAYEKNNPTQTMYPVLPITKKKGTLGVALAGLGAHAQTVLLPYIMKEPSFSLQNVVSSNGLRAKQLATLFKARSCTTRFADALTDPEVDLVFISTKNKQHAEMTVQAAEAGKHIYLEKPMALTEEECERIVDAVKKHNIIFTLGLSRRFAPLVEKAKSLMLEHQPAAINYHLVEQKKQEKEWV